MRFAGCRERIGLVKVTAEQTAKVGKGRAVEWNAFKYLGGRTDLVAARLEIFQWEKPTTVS